MTREEELGIIIDGIENLDNVAMETARKKWNSIAKPLHSLGKLEDKCFSRGSLPLRILFC